jgi:hypothetical protein
MGDDRLHLLGVAVVMALLIALVGNWVAGTYLLSADGAVQPNVQADAEVAVAPSNTSGEPGTVAVRWAGVGPTADGDTEGWADHPLVAGAAATRANDSTLEEQAVGHAERAVAVTDGTWRLAAVGHGVTLAERNATAATRVRLVVTAKRGDAATVIVARTVSL